MNAIKNKTATLAISFLVLFGLIAPVTVLQQTVFAADETSEIKPKKDDCKPPEGEKLNRENCGIIDMIVVITNILTGLAGIVIVGVLIFAGIQYTSAGADPSKIQAAKHRITNAVLALLLLVFGFAIIQWLVPGGLV